MYILVLTVYFALSVAQAAAIIAGLQIWLGLSEVLGAPVGVLLGFVPLIGTAAAIAGAMDGWGWPLMPAAGAFVAPLVLAVAVAILLSFRRAPEHEEAPAAHPFGSWLNRSSSSR